MDNELGPFEPPKEYAFEPELKGDPVRPIPPELRQGRHGVGKYTTIRGLAIAGLCCVATAELPLMVSLSYYVLPLAYLNWIGLALLVGAAGVYGHDALERGPYLWVKEGKPFIARVLQIVVQPGLYVNGQPTNWQFHAEIEWVENGQRFTCWAPSTAVNDPPRFTTSFRVGDYVTGLAMPDRTISLYAFLGLKPGIGLIDREGREAVSNRRILAGVAAVFVIVMLIFHGVKCSPIDVPGALLGYGLLVLFALSIVPGITLASRHHERRLAALDARNKEALARGEALLADSNTYEKSTLRLWGDALLASAGVYLGVILIGTALNAMLDRGERTVRPVLVSDMIQTTWNGVFREYKIKYRFVDQNGQPTGDTESHMSTPSHMKTFRSRLALAKVAPGFFGMRWVESIDPFNPEEHPSPPARRAGASRTGGAIAVSPGP